MQLTKGLFIVVVSLATVFTAGATVTINIKTSGWGNEATVSNGLAWGIVVDSDGNAVGGDFSGSFLNDLAASLNGFTLPGEASFSDPVLLFDEYYFVQARASTVSSGPENGGSDGYMNDLGLFLSDLVDPGDDYGLLWFSVSSGTLTVNDSFGFQYLGTLPSDGSTVTPNTLPSLMAPDLQLSNLAVSPGTVTSPAFTSCSFSVSNNGPTPLISEFIIVDYYLSADTVFDGGDVRIGDTGFTVSLATGASQAIDLSSLGLTNMVDLWPDDLAGGDYYIFAAVRVNDGSPSDPNQSNNYDRTDSAITVDFGGVSATGADFNGDGNSDLIWRNSVDGRVVTWLMDGRAINDYKTIAQVADPAWQIAGNGDFSGDGATDMLWQHSDGRVVAWWLDGTDIAEIRVIAQVMNPAWQIVGVGDLDNDGQSDIIWQNADTGILVAWFMNGTAIRDARAIAQMTNPAWKLSGLGDFDEDGKTDLLWVNSDTGRLQVWRMDGATISGYAQAGVLGDTNWQVIDTGDYNADGSVDILWRHTDGRVVFWAMDGLNQTSTEVIGQVSNPDWLLF